jgi:hypothetical protein
MVTHLRNTALRILPIRPFRKPVTSVGKAHLIMKTTKIPDWLKKILEVSGLEQGKYSFGEDGVELEQLPDEFVGVAECEGGGLAVAKKADGILYRFEQGKVNVYATTEEEFRLEIRRDEAWEELSENMPATKPFWLGIVIKSNNEDGEEMTLGFKGASRDSVMVIQGKCCQKNCCRMHCIGNCLKL